MSQINNINYELIRLFGQDVKIKNYLCGQDPNLCYQDHVTLNLYVKINDACNGNCEFCSNRGLRDDGKLDLEKLRSTLIYLHDKGILNRISVTGGEPLLNPKLLNDTLNLIFSVDKQALVTFNTNGCNLSQVLDFDAIDKVEGIHISRHHYDDDKNRGIFGCDVATYDDIESIMNKSKNKKLLRLNCLLMKDYIDSPDEIRKYLEHASDLGVFRVGFVSLMKVNDYCRNHFVDFNDVFDTIPNSKNVSHHYDKNICECLNGVYVSDSGKFMEYYARMSKDAECDYARQLVYTSDNRLTTGFGKASLI